VEAGRDKSPGAPRKIGIRRENRYGLSRWSRWGVNEFLEYEEEISWDVEDRYGGKAGLCVEPEERDIRLFLLLLPLPSTL